MNITYNGRMIQVVEEQTKTSSGKVKVFERARRAPGVRLFIENEKKELLMNKEFRYELGEHDWRLPGGKVFDDLDSYISFLDSGKDMVDAVKDAAKREGKEEVGVEAKGIEFYSKEVCGATMEWDLRYMILKDVQFGDFALEEDEIHDIQDTVWFSYDSIMDMIKNGEIKEGRTAAVLVKYILSQ